MISLAPSLTIRIAAIVAVAVTLGAIVLGSEGSVGYGVVRESQPTPIVPETTFASELGLQPRLFKLRTDLGIEPAQEANWELFASRMLDLDRASRAFETSVDKPPVGGADERARHALAFAVALSEMDSALSTRQSAILQRETRALGSTFIWAEGR